MQYSSDAKLLVSETGERSADPGWEARYQEHVNSAAAAEPHKSGLNRKQRRALEKELRSVEKKLRKLRELLPGV